MCPGGGDGLPDLALTEVEVTADEYANGVHYDLVEDHLIDAGYDEPFVHFDQFDAPDFLIPAVRQYRAADAPRSSTRRSLMPRIIEMIVSSKGEVTITTKGYAGADCLQASKALEQALGVASSDQKTGEFYQAEAVQQQVQQ